MGISPKNSDGDRHVYLVVADATRAKSYILDIAGGGMVKTILAKTYSALVALFPHEDDPENRWTERRVRALLNEEVAAVGFSEMLELYETAKAAKAERALLENARKEHAAFIEKTASLRALLERQDEAFHSPQIEGLGSGLGRVDLPRDCGE